MRSTVQQGEVVAAVHRRIGAVAVGLVVVLLTTVADAESSGPRQRLTILHTSDVHGRVLPEDGFGSLAQVATLVAEVRTEADHPVLLLDSGDAIQGTPLEELTHVRWERPSPTVDAMNALGYDAMALGNHELNFGLEVLRRAEHQARFPVLAANAVDATSGEPAFRPYTVVDAGEVTVGILGLVTPGIPSWERPEHYAGLRFEPMDEALESWVPRLRRETGCDLVVVLAHTGFERDLGDTPGSGLGNEDFAWRLTLVDGVDVLLAGHTHQLVAPRRVHGVLVAQPGGRARRLTRLDLELERAGDSWRIATWRGELLDVESAPPSDDMLRRFSGLRRTLEAHLSAPVGEVERPLSVHRCRLEDCAALDLVHAAQLEASGADASLASVLTDRTPDLPAGAVSRRWVHSLYVYPNSLLAVRLSGAQVRDVLEHAARYYRGLDCRDGAGCVVRVDSAIPAYNVDSMAGVTYRVDPTQPEGDRVRDLRWRGRPLHDDDQLVVAVNSYRRSGGGRYPHLAEADVVWRSRGEMIDVLVDFLGRHRPWPALADGSWLIAPDITVAGRSDLSGSGFSGARTAPSCELHAAQ